MNKFYMALICVAIACISGIVHAARFSGPAWTCHKVTALTVTRTDGSKQVERIYISASSEGDLGGAPLATSAYGQANLLMPHRFLALLRAYSMVENVPRAQVMPGPDLGIPQLCHEGRETAEVRDELAKWPASTWPRAASGTSNCRGIAWWREEIGIELGSWNYETLDAFGELGGVTVAQGMTEGTLRKLPRPKQGPIKVGPIAFARCWPSNHPKPFDPPYGWSTGSPAPKW